MNVSDEHRKAFFEAEIARHEREIRMYERRLETETCYIERRWINSQITNAKAFLTEAQNKMAFEFPNS